MRKNKKKKLSDCLGEILNLAASGEDGEFLMGLGIKQKDCDNKMLIMARLFTKASSGDISAIKEVRSIMSDTENVDAGLIREIIEAVRDVR